MQNKGFLLFLALIALCILGLVKCNPYVVPWPTPAIHHSPSKILGFSEIWSLTNIYMEQDDFMPKMVATAGKVVFIGKLSNALERISNNEGIRPICLDGASGKVVWEGIAPSLGERGYLSSIFATSDGLYAGYGGVPSVKKLDISSGDVLWFQLLSGRGLPYLFVIGNEVMVLTDPFIFSVLNEDDGEIIRSMKGEDIFISTDNETYLPWGPDGLRAIKTDTGEILWDVILDQDLRLAPTFTDKVIYMRSGSTIGSVYALDRSTGKILWKTNKVVVSNLALSEQDGMVFMLTRNGELWGVKKNTGEITTLIEFSNSPFILNGEEIVGGYELAYDQTTRSLYILLGDSRQLFAFKEEE